MTTENVTKRASKAIHLLNKADEDLVPLVHELTSGDNINRVRDGLRWIAKARQELRQILAQENEEEKED